MPPPASHSKVRNHNKYHPFDIFILSLRTEIRVELSFIWLNILGFEETIQSNNWRNIPLLLETSQNQHQNILHRRTGRPFNMFTLVSDFNSVIVLRIVHIHGAKNTKNHTPMVSFARLFYVQIFYRWSGCKIPCPGGLIFTDFSTMYMYYP